MRNEKAIRRNKELVDKIKADGMCADCGRWFPPCAMDFDHVHGAKMKNVSILVGEGASIFKVLAEINKCDLVCACCHRVRTATRRHKGVLA